MWRAQRARGRGRGDVRIGRQPPALAHRGFVTDDHGSTAKSGDGVGPVELGRGRARADPASDATRHRDRDQAHSRRAPQESTSPCGGQEATLAGGQTEPTSNKIDAESARSPTDGGPARARPPRDRPAPAKSSASGIPTRSRSRFGKAASVCRATRARASLGHADGRLATRSSSRRSGERPRPEATRATEC